MLQIRGVKQYRDINDVQIISNIQCNWYVIKSIQTLTNIKNCINVKFQNKGVANIAQGATTIVINSWISHYTPVLSQFILTPDKNTAIFITNITSNQFTMNIPASVTGGVNIGWKIKY